MCGGGGGGGGGLLNLPSPVGAHLAFGLLL